MNNNGNINDGKKVDEHSSSIDAPHTKGVPRPSTGNTVKGGGNSFDPKNTILNKNDVNRLQQALSKKNEPLTNNQNNQSENEKKEERDQQEQPKKEGLVKEGAKTAVTQAGGTAITAASGGLIPKPISDMFASKLSRPFIKMLKYQMLMFALPILLLLIVIIPVIIAGSSSSSKSSGKKEEVNNTPSGSYCTGDPIQATELKGISREKCIELFGPMAQSEYVRTGVLASVTLGQIIVEANCGDSDVARGANNLFGIKYAGPGTPKDGWDGKSYYNYVSPKTGKTTKYKKYANVNDGIINHSALLTNGSYNKDGVLVKQTTYMEQLKALQGGVTGEKPRSPDSYYCQGDGCSGNNGMDYVNAVAKVIEQNNLTKWDVKTAPNLACAPINADWKLRTVAPTKSDKAFDYLKKTNVGQCVWYAQGRAVEILQELMKNGKIDKSTGEKAIKRLGQIQANAEGWYRGAKGKFKRSTNIKDVKAGSIIVWGGGSTMCTPRCGHVAMVESVTDKEVIVTDGWADDGDKNNKGKSCPKTWNCIQFRTRTMSLEQFYKYAKKESGEKTFTGYIYFLELDD